MILSFIQNIIAINNILRTIIYVLKINTVMQRSEETYISFSGIINTDIQLNSGDMSLFDTNGGENRFFQIKDNSN